MTALNLSVLAHSEGHHQSVVDRETVYRTSLNESGIADITFRVTVHQDNAYAFQSYARLDLFATGVGFTRFFSIQDGERIVAGAAWEIEDFLIESVARLFNVHRSTVATETQGALYEAGFDPLAD